MWVRHTPDRHGNHFAARNLNDPGHLVALEALRGLGNHARTAPDAPVPHLAK
ncbi:hypothetical protein Ntsu_47440 [Nocardia sp. IFM 10818]